MVTGAVFEYDAGRYVLPAEHAVLLTSPRASNIGPAVGTLRTLSAVLPAVERCFTEGGGVPYAQYAEAAGETLGDSWRYIYDEQLIDGFLGRVPGLPGRLAAGARVLDLGCGSGHAVNLMAQAYPRSTFTASPGPLAAALAAYARREDAPGGGEPSGPGDPVPAADRAAQYVAGDCTSDDPGLRDAYQELTDAERARRRRLRYSPACASGPAGTAAAGTPSASRNPRTACAGASGCEPGPDPRRFT
jgi:hypothetical protein